MLIDDFAHQHFPVDVGMQPVNGEFCVHDLVAGVVKEWFQIYEMGLAANPAVYLLEFGRPASIRRGMESKLDIGRIDGHESQEYRPYIIGFAFLADGR